jgi:pilus biogenesis lipoprotein CpaD
MQRNLVLLLLPLALSSCAGNLDYHGVSPRTYNEQLYHKENKVESKSAQQVFTLTQHDVFSRSTLMELDQFVAPIYPSAVERLVIAMPNANNSASLYVTRQLRSRGFKKSVMEYVYDETLQSNEVLVQMDYSVVVTPNCPDWRKSTDLNYSNTNFSNMECATVTNLGKQIANPRHLIQSDGAHVAPDAAVGAKAISNYRGAIASSTSSSSSDVASTDTAATVQ